MEVNLEKTSGLPISFNAKNLNLEFHVDFPFIKESERSLEELRPYLKNSDAKSNLDPVYRVWRYAHLKKDNEKIRAADLHYDLTLIPPGKIGDEFSKTAGHYHKPYPEVYEVILGRAYFLIQSESAVYLAEAGPGEKFLIPPGFGHNTINAFNSPLLLANWVSEKAVYNYETYENNHGAMYYLINNNNLVDIVKNSKYNPIPEIKKVKLKEYPEFGLIKNAPLYDLVNNLEKLRFLNYPLEFENELKI